MTTVDKVIKTKVGLLELGKQLGNVTKAIAATVLIGSRNSTTEVERQRCKRSRGANPT